MNKAIKDTAMYGRTSGQDQNCETQSMAIRNYCARLDYRIVGEYIDDGYSGKNDNRPAFERLLKDIRDGKVTRVMVYKLDRIGRSLKHLLNLFEEFKKQGVEFISITQNIDTNSPEGKMFWQMLGVFAEFERELIVARTRSGLERARKEGKTLGRPKGRKDTKQRRKSGYLLRYAKKGAI